MSRAVRGAPAGPVCEERCATPNPPGARACATPATARRLGPRVSCWGSSPALVLFAATLAVLPSACGTPKKEPPAAEAPKTATVPAADASGAQADNPQC